jgi:hypothetical protein
MVNISDEVFFIWLRGFFFKGASFGIYNTGNGKPTLCPADFAYWKQVATK